MPPKHLAEHTLQAVGARYQASVGQVTAHNSSGVYACMRLETTHSRLVLPAGVYKYRIALQLLLYLACPRTTNDATVFPFAIDFNKTTNIRSNDADATSPNAAPGVAAARPTSSISPPGVVASPVRDQKERQRGRLRCYLPPYRHVAAYLVRDNKMCTQCCCGIPLEVY